MRKTRCAFSLVEVVIAVAIFAAAVAVILALLPSLTRQSIEVSDELVAQRMADAIQSELTRIAAAGGFDVLSDSSTIPVMAVPLSAGLSMVASRDGGRLHTESYLPPPSAGRLAESERYFLIELWKFSAGKLAYDPSGTVLPLYARISWPYRTPGAIAPTPPAERQEIAFVVSILR